MNRQIDHGWHYGPGSTYWFSGYFNVTLEEMQTWCEENLLKSFLVVRLRLFDPASNSKLHIKLVAVEDIVLFKLTWL